MNRKIKEMYLSKKTIKQAVADLRGTANHLIKIWFVLKAMGMDTNTSVTIDTGNSTPALKRLFSCGAPDGSFYIPFAHTKRFAFMKADASRSIIQTNIQRWGTSESVVTCNPCGYLDIRVDDTGQLTVSPGRQYPLGLGNGRDGFALDDGLRTVIPDLQFAIWLFAKEAIDNGNPEELIKRMRELLHLSIPELKTVFIQKQVDISYQESVISDYELFEICENAFMDSHIVEEVSEKRVDYIRRVQNMTTINDNPRWMQSEPTQQLSRIIDAGEKAILLYGPPRTGKTRAIDSICDRTNADRVTIQIHEGWGYENLVIGLFPSSEPENYSWKEGLLLHNIRKGIRHIVLEEINRTRISQALGECFSLIETKYRGKNNAILLPDASRFWIPDDVVIYLTMNTIDASTEDVDDALIGRVASVYFPPRVENLNEILEGNKVPSEQADKIIEVFNCILKNYPIGHGYFAMYNHENDFKYFYLSRIRPVIANHFETYKPEILSQIDNCVDALFGAGE